MIFLALLIFSLAKPFSQQNSKLMKNGWAGPVLSNVLKKRQSQPMCAYKLRAYKEKKVYIAESLFLGSGPDRRRSPAEW